MAIPSNYCQNANMTAVNTSMMCHMPEAFKLMAYCCPQSTTSGWSCSPGQSAVGCTFNISRCRCFPPIIFHFHDTGECCWRSSAPEINKSLFHSSEMHYSTCIVRTNVYKYEDIFTFSDISQHCFCV